MNLIYIVPCPKKKRIRESITFQFLFSEGIFLIFHDSGMKCVIVIQNNFNIMIYFVKCLNFDRDYFLQATERKVRSSGNVSSVLPKDERWVLYLRVRKYDVFNVLVQCIDLNQILHYYMYALKYLIKQTIIDNINIRKLIYSINPRSVFSTRNHTLKIRVWWMVLIELVIYK